MIVSQHTSLYYTITPSREPIRWKTHVDGLLPSSANKAFHFHLHVAVIPCNMTAVPTVAIIACLQLPYAALTLIIIGVMFDTTELMQSINWISAPWLLTHWQVDVTDAETQSTAFKLQVANLQEYDGMIRVGWEPLKWHTRHVARKHSVRSNTLGALEMLSPSGNESGMKN